MVEGPSLARSYPLGDSMIDVTGIVSTSDEPPTIEELAAGFSEGEPSGESGLELAYNSRLAGKPGGTLMAVPLGSEPDAKGRVLGEGEPEPAKPLKTSIDPDLQESAVANLAGQLGGVAVLDTRTGNVKALAGQAYSVLRPPGSTMKIVTATAGLEAGKTTLDTEYEYATSGVADGREIENAGGEVCGGTLVESFANSCNSVFAPLGMEIGEEQLTETAELYGFNEVPAIFDEEATAAVEPPAPTIPQPGEYNNELGVSAIGQGTVQATPLQMATVAQTVANKGVRLPTPIASEKDLRSDAGPVTVTSPEIARQVTELMVAVVTSGTGTAAAIPEAQVAGKTGTAEIGPSGEVDGEGNPVLIEDAWFAGFAPADKPRLAVGVLVMEQSGGGGTIAAPIAGAVLSAGL
jgi:cell division protein FtsI/penicillin-binding protein 2